MAGSAKLVGLRFANPTYEKLSPKHRKGIGKEAFVQLLGCDHFYRRHRGLKRSRAS
jgi:hypothetical protein